MKSFRCTAALVIALSLAVWAQDQDASSSSSAPGGKQGEADQAVQSAEPRAHTTIIGCLSGPDAAGKYTLRSMGHRTGVEAFGPDGLKNASGHKVKLTGRWTPGDQPAAKGKESRRFQVAELEVLSEQCQAPSETTPVSKQKQARQQQKQQGSTPTSTDTTTPK